MIRVVTLDEFNPLVLKQLTKVLYTAFGVGTEHAGTVAVPSSFHEPLDAQKLLLALPKVSAFSDDKVLYLTTRKLAPRKLASGEAPTYGVSQYAGQRALVTTAHVKLPVDKLEDKVEEAVKPVARFAMQELGHTYGLYHCLDPRCAMYAQWTPTYSTAEATFCTFCRDLSEAKIRQAKS